MSQIIKKGIGGNQVGGAQFRLENTTGLRARNTANTADIELLELTASDEVQLGSVTYRVQNPFILYNDVNLKGRNAANTADINIIKLNSSNIAELGVNLDGGGFVISNFIANLKHLASDPGSPVAGEMYYNTTSNVVRFYNGTVWADMSSGGSGANTTLSNLTSPTAINQDLIMTAGKTIRLANQVWMTGRNVADTADLDIVEINGNDEIVLNDGSGGTTGAINLTQRVLFSSSTDFSVDWEGRRLMVPSNNNPALIWSSYQTYDTAGVVSLDWGSRTLTSAGNALLLDYSGSQLKTYADIVPSAPSNNTVGDLTNFFGAMAAVNYQVVDSTTGFDIDVIAP